MPQRVLVIDDSPLMHRLVEAWLKCDSLRLTSAFTGAEGFDVAVTSGVDLILLDVDMPDVNGFDLCRRLRSDPRCSRVPIIFLTGASSPEDRVAGLNLGAVDYIIKPFHPAEFQARVRSALRTKQLVDLLEERAEIDGLTALHNRAFLDQRLLAELSMLTRREGELSCVMLDVDNFKSVNDQYGHLAGDEVLRSVSRDLMAGTRAEDIVARYGGEEFVVLTPGVGIEGAALLAERLREQIQNNTVARLGGSIRVTCSFGVATYDAANASSLIKNADDAMYRAKRTGKNRVVRYTPDLSVKAA